MSFCETVISKIQTAWPDAQCFAFPEEDCWVIEIRTNERNLYYISIVGYWLYVNLPNVTFHAENPDTFAAKQPCHAELEILHLFGSVVSSFPNDDISFPHRVIKRIKELQPKSSYVFQSSPLMESVVLPGNKADKPDAHVAFTGAGWKFGVRFCGGLRYVKVGELLYTVKEESLCFHPDKPETYTKKKTFRGNVDAMVKMLYDTRVNFLLNKEQINNPHLLVTARALLQKLKPEFHGQTAMDSWRKPVTSSPPTDEWKIAKSGRNARNH